MPLPSPRNGEKSDDFLPRCMSDEQAKKDFPDRSQRFAVCSTRLKKADHPVAGKKKRKKGDLSFSLTKHSLPLGALTDIRQRRKFRRLNRRRHLMGRPEIALASDRSPDLSFSRGDLTTSDLAASGGLLVPEQGGKFKRKRKNALSFVMGSKASQKAEAPVPHDTGPTPTKGPDGLIIPKELQGLPASQKSQDALKRLFMLDVAQLPAQVQSFALRELEKAEMGDVVSPETIQEIFRVASATSVLIQSPDLRKAEGEVREDPLQIKKRDDEKQIVWGEVYIPDLPDSQGDSMTAEEIEKAAYLFMANQRLDQIDQMHDEDCAAPEATVVESFIAREGDQTFIPGSWVVGVHIRNQEVWEAVKSGKFNGFSLQGKAVRTEKQFELNLPEEITGTTSTDNKHPHKFSIKFGDQGQFFGGETSADSDPTAGPGELHSHPIQNGTVTEVSGANPHTHRYSVSEAILAVSIGRRPPGPDLIAAAG